MSVVHFGEEPYAVHLLDVDGKETEDVCPLLAVEGDKGLVVRQREIFWWPLDRIRVILQPEVKPEIDPPDLSDWRARAEEADPTI